MTMYDGDVAHRTECAELHIRIQQAVERYADLHNKVQQLINEVKTLLEEHKSLTEDSRTHAAIASSFDVRALAVEVDALRRALVKNGINPDAK